MILVEDNAYRNECDNCPVRPKRQYIVRGKNSEASGAHEYTLVLCKRCLKRMGKEMIEFAEVNNASTR
jgi:hypothetical protein